ncbi:MAG: GNAT family N-acetyltransferase [Planctomycetota bacterium]|nr:MAG: GNAT family N-acetyltransferase [Planctomycetota bacterium]
MIRYALEPDLSADEFIDVLRRSTLAERRPVDRPDVIAAMLRNADIVLTARVDGGERHGLLVGISRAVTDYSYCCYLSDLAVDEAFQGHGIGRELIHRTHEAAGKHTMLILIAAPKAETYYPHIGMTPHGSCWYVPRGPWPEAIESLGD